MVAVWKEPKETSRGETNEPPRDWSQGAADARDTKERRRCEIKGGTVAWWRQGGGGGEAQKGGGGVKERAAGVVSTRPLAAWGLSPGGGPFGGRA